MGFYLKPLSKIKEERRNAKVIAAKMKGTAVKHWKPVASPSYQTCLRHLGVNDESVVVANIGVSRSRPGNNFYCGLVDKRLHSYAAAKGNLAKRELAISVYNVINGRGEKFYRPHKNGFILLNRDKALKVIVN